MMDNRKYLTSTGLLLKNLNEEHTNNYSNQVNMYQQTNSNNFMQQNQYNQTFSNNSMNFQYNNNTIFNQQLNPPLLNQPFNLPDIMVLPNSMSHQRWQQKPRPQQPPKQSQNFNKPPKQAQQHKSNLITKKTQSSSSLTSISNSSSITELPETFGLPSNQTIKQTSSISLNKHTNSSSNLAETFNKQSEILIDDSISPKSKSDEIEIINEINSNSIHEKNTSITSSTTITNQQNEDINSNLKNYLSKNYLFNKQASLSITTKPQSNFISNLDCINQLLTKTDYYNNKLKRCKPYSNLKPNAIFRTDDDDDDSEDDEDANEQEDESKKPLKNKKIILIDDSNEEMHKPWITPELIKLIKHRNLLQSKLNESNQSNAVQDEELLKKFKNLRNKVTKLVKKARKEYIAKYIQESKENKLNTNESNESKTQTISETTQSATTTTTQLATGTTSSTQPTTSSTTVSQSVNTQNSTVNEITDKLTTSGSFLKDSNTLMMSMYTNYYNQYIQQYTKQQQEAQALMSSGEMKEGDENYEKLQKQAAYYAQQQLAIQQQLEKSLVQASHQLIQEIAEMAAAKANQPFVLNQFSQQHHLHQHHHMIPGQLLPPNSLGPVPTTSLIGHPPIISLHPPPNQASMPPIGVTSKMFY